MGRKKKGETAVESPKKKHKKNKHKKRCTPEVEDGPSLVDKRVREDTASIHRPIKLKIKLGDQLISSSSATTIDSPVTGDDASSLAESESLMGGASGSSLGGGGGGSSVDIAEGSSLGIPDEDLAASDVSVGKDDFGGGDAGSGMDEEEEDEEAWLDALETGEVNERGYLPQKRDSGSLTARQRAMLGGDGEHSPGELMELPLGRSTEELTEEMLLKKTENNRKRRLAAQKRKEKRKAETVRKLLEKQNTKKKDDEKTQFPKRPIIPHIRYINSCRVEKGEVVVGSTLSLPSGMELPIATIKSNFVPSPVQCAVEGCHNPKKYCDSLNRLPICSLECYRIIQARTKPASATA